MDGLICIIHVAIMQIGTTV